MEVHTPVLLQKVIEIFNPQPGERYIDATINGGGHARALAEKVGPEGKILGIDWDCKLIEESRIKNQELMIKNITFVCGNYADIAAIAKQHDFDGVHGILFDLGFSSYHLEQSGRGFSFLKDEPLDMRYSLDTSFSAADIINNSSEEDLIKMVKEYGEERFAKRIAKEIINERMEKRIDQTDELIEIIKKSVPSWYRRKKIHFATKTFQALRIAVNNELDNMARAIRGSLASLVPGGRIAVISFHSLEDRIVKTFFREQARENHLIILTKKPLRASHEEIKNNPRARSAKLRGAITPLS